MKVAWIGIRLAVAAAICLPTTRGARADCHGPESIYAKELVIFGTQHGLHGSHTTDRYFDYPVFWNKCYEEFEDSNFDAYDETVPVGPALGFENCQESTSNVSPTYSVGVSISASLSGTSSSEIGAELEWKDTGKISYGEADEITWYVNTTVSGTASLTMTDIEADTKVYAWPYARYAHRQGGRYYYVLGPVKNWCVTHEEWGDTYENQVDYYSVDVAQTTYVAEAGVHADECHPCNCTMDWNGENKPVVLGSKISFTSGANWYNQW